jgi:hypothetical protein
MSSFVLHGSPCLTCPGNERLCSLTDTEVEFNALNCNLIIDWVCAPKLGRPIGQTE